MAKHRVQKAAVKGTRRSATITRARKSAANRSLYPSEELKALFTFTGKATIQGVHFDLSPEELVQQGWKPWELALGEAPFANTDLHFPWEPARPKYLESFIVRPGDTVSVQISSQGKGSSLDHAADQGLSLVRYVVTRNGKIEHREDDPVEYYRDSSFLLWLDFNTAVHRLRALEPDRVRELVARVGDRKTDPSTYGQPYWDRALAIQDKHEDAEALAYSDRAISGAFAATASWAAAVAKFRKNDPRKIKPNGRRGTDTDILDVIEGAIDAATAFGYWLAKMEFEPHSSDTLFGKKRKQDQIKAGQKTGSAAARHADMEWRTAGLQHAQSIRDRNSKIGQGPLADEVIKALKAEKKKPPEHDSVVYQIKVWERGGVLNRSISNPLSKGGRAS